MEVYDLKIIFGIDNTLFWFSYLAVQFDRFFDLFLGFIIAELGEKLAGLAVHPTQLVWGVCKLALDMYDSVVLVGIDIIL